MSKHREVAACALDGPSLGEIEFGGSKQGYSSIGLRFGHATVKFKAGSVNVVVCLL